MSRMTEAAGEKIVGIFVACKQNKYNSIWTVQTSENKNLEYRKRTH